VDSIGYAELESGRCFLARLPHGEDLLKTMEAFCEKHGIRNGVFSIIGAVTSVTLGSYDQKQQVYVTAKKEEALEIVHCAGNISLKDGKVFVHAHAVLADEKGETTGGHLFSDTKVFAGEMYVRELVGSPLERAYDETTGLYLWKW
jgi:predicted DNA-binding protein with PD1-like motif